ncbi:MAG: metallophosphoesterase [Bacilli bacterium]
MKKFNKIAPLFLVALLTSCQKVSNPPLTDYINELDYKENFTILSLNDIHLSILTDLDEEFNYIENVIFARCETEGLTKEEAKPDLIVLNGDTFMDVNSDIVSKFFSFIDSFNIPFAYTYGNHDLQGLYGNKYIDKVVKKCRNSVLLNPSDNVYGNANYVINLKENGDTKWQVYVLDSNTYYGLGYDVIHDDQIEWYKKQIRYANNLSDDVNKSDVDLIPSIAYFHIPLEEFQEAWEEVGMSVSGTDRDSYWRMEESSGVASGYRSNLLFETMNAFRSTRGIVCGHDHINFSDFHYIKGENTDFPIRLIYGLKSSKGIYHDPFLMGGTFITLKDDKTFSMKPIQVTYSGQFNEMSVEEIVNKEINENE